MGIEEGDEVKLRRMLRLMIRVPVRAPDEYTIGSPRVNSLGKVVYPIEYPESAELRKGRMQLHRSEFHPTNEHGWCMMRHFYSSDGLKDRLFQVGLAEGPAPEAEAFGLNMGVMGFKRRDWEDCDTPNRKGLREGEDWACPRKEMQLWNTTPKSVLDLAARYKLHSGHDLGSNFPDLVVDAQ